MTASNVRVFVRNGGSIFAFRTILLLYLFRCCPATMPSGILSASAPVLVHVPPVQNAEQSPPPPPPHGVAEGYVLRKRNAECSARDEDLAP